MGGVWGAPYLQWEEREAGALETECQHGWEPTERQVLGADRVCPWLSLPGGVEELGEREPGSAPGSGLSPTCISGSCHSAFVGSSLSFLYGYGFGNVFCRV